MQLDEWQKEILKTDGNILLVSGRQVGKSTIIARRDGDFAIKNNNKSILIISATERQSEELFMKCYNYIKDKAPSLIKKGKDRPTKHIIKLTNGSIIRCLPTGDSGMGIRGFTIDRLTADEAAYIKEEVWMAVTPMLLTTGGNMCLVSTPCGRAGHFFRCYQDPTFKVFHVNSEEVIKNRKISDSWTNAQREGAIQHLEREKSRMSSREYAQEYMGEFIDELMQFFPDNLISTCQNRTRDTELFGEPNYFMGMDIAQLGDDETTFEIVSIDAEKKLHHVESIKTTKTRLNETVNKALELDKKYNFGKIYIDDAGIGVGVFDYLLENEQTKRKVIPINNRSRPLDKDKTQKKKMLKEDLYNNLLMLMEQGRINLLKDDEIYLSLKSVQYEYIITKGGETRLRIFGKYTHHAEGLIRAAQAVRDKSIKIWCR